MNKKILTLAVMLMALGSIAGYSQAPTTTAPTPMRNSDQIKSAFSDTYPAFTKWNRQHGATMETLTINGDDNVLKFEGDYVAVSVGGRNLANMEYFHADVYLPTSGGVSQVRFGFALFSGGEKYADAYNTDTPARQWTSIDIPLSAFNGYDFSDAQVFRMTMTKTPGNVFYMDNVYFYTTNNPKPQPIQDSTVGELPPMNSVMLGVNLSSASGGKVPGTFGYDYMYPRLEDLYYFKAKGCRLIRLPFRAARFVEDLDDPKPDYSADKSDVQAMKDVVAEAERLGIWVFLDAHDYAERTFDGTQYLLGEGDYTIQKFAKMWGVIANEFKGYSNIWGYDLQNEPKVKANVLVEAYQATIDEIRKVDTNAQIIVEGTNWASAYEWIYGNRPDMIYPEYSTEVAWSYKKNSPWLLADLDDPQNKLVFQAHGYFDSDNSGTYTKGYQEVDFRKCFLPFLEWCRTSNVKGLIGEFGVPYNGHPSGDEHYMDMLDSALKLFRDYQVNATYWCAGAMYEGNSLSVQPDKHALYGNYAVEKSTMKVLEPYFTNWDMSTEDSGIDEVIIGNSYESATQGRIYNMMGIEVDENYKGIVIRNGKKYIQK